MTMLKSVLLSNPSPTCAIIQDDNTVKGTDLFKALLRHDIENDAVKEVHLVACDYPPEHYLGAVSDSKIHVHNLFQDPSCWLQKNNSPCDEVVDKMLNCKENPSSILIDSINVLIFLKNEDYAYKTIHKLKRKFKKVTCLLHRDEITCNETIKKLLYLSNVNLKLYSVQSKHSSHLIDDKKKLVEGVHVKQNGKISKFNEIINVNENFHLHCEVYEDVKHDSRSSVIDNFKNLTTFRLGLDIKENEKIARDNLVLPYLKTSKGDDKTESEEGKIVYYADSEDDLEEDPDDDLDI